MDESCFSIIWELCRARIIVHLKEFCLNTLLQQTKPNMTDIIYALCFAVKLLAETKYFFVEKTTIHKILGSLLISFNHINPLIRLLLFHLKLCNDTDISNTVEPQIYTLREPQISKLQIRGLVKGRWPFGCCGWHALATQQACDYPKKYHITQILWTVFELRQNCNVDGDNFLNLMINIL